MLTYKPSSVRRYVISALVSPHALRSDTGFRPAFPPTSRFIVNGKTDSRSVIIGGGGEPEPRPPCITVGGGGGGRGVRGVLEPVHPIKRRRHVLGPKWKGVMVVGRCWEA